MKPPLKWKQILVTGGAGFVGSNLALALQEQHPNAWIVVVDDFRSGSFKKLASFRGDVVAEDVSRLDWKRPFGNTHFDNPYPSYQPHTEADLALAHKALGCQPQFTLEKGIQDYHASRFLTAS